MVSENNAMDVQSLKLDIFNMLTHLLEKFNTSNDSVYGQRYVGKVVKYDEETKSAKIKVSVFGVYDEIPDDALPWCYPIEEHMSGESFILPEIGSLVSVYFEQNDIYRPYYTTKVKVPTFTGPNAGSKTNATIDGDGVTFGDQMVLFENAGNVLQFNRNTNRLVYKNSNGILININGSENGTHDAESADVANSINIKVGDNDEYSLSIYPKGIKISNGASSAEAYVQIENDKINILTEDGGVLIGSKTNATAYDETTTMRSTSPGAVVPDPANMGPYCAIPVCPFSGMPHQGNLMTVTGAPVNASSISSAITGASDLTAPTDLIK